MSFRWAWRFLALAVFAVLLVSCAQERAPINRVQPNALKKSFFVGENLLSTEDDPEFYTRGTMLETGYGLNPFPLCPSWASSVARIKWEITEDLLVARLTYERIQDSDHFGSRTSKLGQIVAAYRIMNHFDIRRGYNPSTGEELNVVEENASDRPWYEREYFRVDWSLNHVGQDMWDLDNIAQLSVYNGMTLESMSYYVNDPSDADAPVFDENAGYFDFVGKVYAKPGQIDTPWGTVPACLLRSDYFYGTWPWGNCYPQELRVRYSFRKVVDKDYEPQDWDGNKFVHAGIWNIAAERYGYDTKYGMVDTKWHRFAALFNIWAGSHVREPNMTMVQKCVENPLEECVLANEPAENREAKKQECCTLRYSRCNTSASTTVGQDPHRDLDNNGTEDECEWVTSMPGMVAGSHCDEFTQQCTIPFRKRVAITTPYFYGLGSVDDLFGQAKGVVEEWSQIVRKAVHAARLVECRRTKSGRPVRSESPPIRPGGMTVADYQIALDKWRRDVEWPFLDGYAAWDADCQQQYPLDNPPKADPKNPNDTKGVADIFVLCHNPVTDKDAPACGPPGLSARLGDIRYNIMNIFPGPETASPWGVRMDGDDPLTGEKVTASTNVWDWVDWNAAQRIVDSMRWLNGELTDADIRKGDYLNETVKADEFNRRTRAQHATILSEEEVRKRIEAGTAAGQNAAALRGSKGSPSTKYVDPNAPPNQMENPLKYYSSGAGTMAAEASSRLIAARNSGLEAQLVSAPWLQLAGLDANTPVDDTTLAKASPLRGNFQQWRSQYRHRLDLALEQKGVCMIDAPGETLEPTSLTGAAKIMLEKKYPISDYGDSPSGRQKRINDMVTYLRKRLLYGVLAHEMGHSVGLRHQFTSSYDALNYMPQYWQLRTRNGTVKKKCDKPATDDGTSCVGPRWYDPVTDEENDGLIWMWAIDTVMDYPGDQFQDFIGPGPQDYHNLLLAYGGVLDTYSEATCTPRTQNPSGNWCQETEIEITATAINVNDNPAELLLNRQVSTAGGGLVGGMYFHWGINAPWYYGLMQNNSSHYSEIGNYLGLLRDCVTVDPNQYKPAWFDPKTDGRYNATMDGLLVEVNGEYKVCSKPPHDVSDYRDMIPAATPEATAAQQFNVGGGNFHNVDKNTYQVGWPYLNASDNWADIGNLAVMRHDNGADPYEQFSFWTAQWEDSHLFSDFRRNRTSFTVRGTVDRSQSRYHEKMKNVVQGMSLIWRNGYDPAATYDGGFKAHALAVSLGFEHFTRNLTRPNSGLHAPGRTLYNDTVLLFGGGSAQNPAVLQVPEGSQLVPATTGLAKPTISFGGKIVNNALSDNYGDYNVEYLEAAGSYYDKIASIFNMSESVDRFVSQSPQDFNDPRYRNLSFATLFPDGLRRLYAAIMAGDGYALGPRVAADATGVLHISDTDLRPRYGMGWVQFWPAGGPEVCIPTGVRNICLENPTGAPVTPGLPVTRYVAVDPQVAFEEQKFTVFYGLLYLPENWKTDWIDMFRIYRTGTDSQLDLPTFHAVWHKDPISGNLYIAHSYGKEPIFGRSVDRGIAARMLETANLMAQNAFIVTATDPTTGVLTFQYNPDGSPTLKAGTTCSFDSACSDYVAYKSVIDYTRQVAATFGFPTPDPRGLDFN